MLEICLTMACFSFTATSDKQRLFTVLIRLKIQRAKADFGSEANHGGQSCDCPSIFPASRERALKIDTYHLLDFQTLMKLLYTVPTHNKHIFEGPKKVCLLWEKCLFQGSGRFRILGTIWNLVLELDFLYITFEKNFSDFKNVSSQYFEWIFCLQNLRKTFLIVKFKKETMLRFATCE